MLFNQDISSKNKKVYSTKMRRLIEFPDKSIIALGMIVLTISSCSAQDYEGETETAITGLGGLGGLGGLSGFSGLSALANGVVTGYAPIGSGSENGGSDSSYQSDGSERGLGASESSDTDTGDYEDDSNDSSASEEHPILSKFFNLISGGRHKRSIEANLPQIDTQANQAHSRVKRGYKGWVPYVSTYVKTDKKANFKWGVKAKVGKKYGK